MKYKVGRINKIGIILLSICISLLFASCSIFKHSKSSENKLTKQQIEEFNNNYFLATKERLLGNYENAVKYYGACVKIDITNSDIFYELGKLYFKSKQLKEAIIFTRRAVELDSKNIWYKLLLAEIYNNTGKYEDAAKLYEQLIELDTDNFNYYYECVSCYIYAGKINESIRICNKFEKSFGITEDMSMQKEKIYVQLKKYDLARNEINALIEKFPNEIKYKGTTKS